MRGLRLGAAILGLACRALFSEPALAITTTPSHTSTPTPTPTPTATFGPTVVATPKPTPWLAHGTETLVPETTSGDQTAPSVAIDRNGRSVVAWRSAGQDGDAGGVFGRRFDAKGAPLAGEFLVNTTTLGDQSEPAVASDGTGKFVVVWTTPDAGGDTDVVGRRYDANGNPLSGEFQVNTYSTGVQGSPRIAMDDQGFVVVWSSAAGQDGEGSGIFGQRFSVNGVPNDDEFQVNSYTTGDQRAPSVGMVPVGAGAFSNFTVVWESRGQDGDQGGIFGQNYLDTGDPFGPEFQVNDVTAGDQTNPDVEGNNQFVVVWESDDGSGKDIWGLVDSWILWNTSSFRINRQTAGDQTHPRVRFDAFRDPSNFVVAWEDQNPGSPGIFARRFDNTPYPTAVSFLVQPKPVGAEYRIDDTADGIATAPAIAWADDGEFVVAWQRTGAGANEDVFQRAFDFPSAKTMNVDQAPSGGPSNGNGVLDPGETVLVAPSWTNQSDFPITLTGSASNLTGADGPTRAIDDPVADYGSLSLHGFTSNCATATDNCYELTVSGERPAPHWDDTFDEHPDWTAALGTAPPWTKTWSLHVGGSFPDVPQDVFYPYIENLLHNGITAGGGCGIGLYCGEDQVLRRQMAVFLLKARLGPEYVPPAATGTVFGDVPAPDPFAPWIEELSRRAVTAGCSAPPPPELPLYCPDAPVNRQQMAVFLVKAYWGFDIVGDFCAGLFDDVPCSNPFAPWIEFIANQGVTGGCQLSPPLYCPTDFTKRKQMAAFLVKTFGLQLYGPD